MIYSNTNLFDFKYKIVNANNKLCNNYNMFNVVCNKFN